MGYAATPYAIILFATAAVSLTAAVVLWKRQTAHESRPIVHLLAAGAEWAMAGGFEASAVPAEMKIFWAKIGYLGLSIMPALFVLFAFDRGKRGGGLPRISRLLLPIPALANIVLAFTNELHGLVWSGYIPGPEGSNLLVYRYGVAFWIISFVNIAFLLAALWRFTVLAQRSEGIGRLQNIALGLSTLFPIIGAALYLMPYPLFPGIDTVLLSYILTCFCMAAGMLRFRLFDLMPIAQKKVMENIRDGVIVLDRRHRIVEANPASAGFSPSIEDLVPGTQMADAFPWWNGVRDLASDLPREEIIEFGPDPNRLRTAECGISSLNGARGKTVGWIVTLHDVTRQRTAEKDLLAAVENLQKLNAKHIQDLVLARNIQRSLLPDGQIDFPGITISSAYAPCEELGGDIVGVFPVDDTHIAVYGGDVSGHGVYAAMVMSYVKKLIETSVKRVYIKQHFMVKPPGAVLTTINKNFISEINLGDPEIYLTLFLGMIDLKDLTLEYSSAGIHVPPQIVMKEEIVDLFQVSDVPIGYDPHHEYATELRRIRRGEAVLFVTDGVVDAHGGGGRIGMEGVRTIILNVLRSAGSIRPADVLEGVKNHLGAKGLEDDMCMLSIEFAPAVDHDPQSPDPHGSERSHGEEGI